MSKYQILVHRTTIDCLKSKDGVVHPAPLLDPGARRPAFCDLGKFPTHGHYLPEFVVILHSPSHRSKPKLRGTVSNNPNRKLQSDPVQEDLCASIVAIALTRDPSVHGRQQQRKLQALAPKAGKIVKTSPTTSPTTSSTLKSTIDESVSSQDLGEEFACERSTTGELLPLIGNEEQMAQLREALNNGELVSAETTIAGLTEENVGSVNVPGVEDGSYNPFVEGGYGSNDTVVTEIVNLPIGELKFKPGYGQYSLRRRLLTDIGSEDAPNRRLAVYEGVKTILFVRVIDKDGKLKSIWSFRWHDV